MSTINRTMFPIQAGFDQITKLQDRFAKLQVQLATGEKATNLAELGSDRYFDLSLRARLSRIEGYKSSIDTVTVRVNVLDIVMSRLDEIEGDARTAMAPGGYGTDDLNLATSSTLARSRLDEVLNLLNSDVAGRYLFGGSTTDKKPVETVSAILDGAAGRAGFKQVVSERTAADLGASGLGRLTLTNATGTATLTEDGAHPFGFKLSTLTTSGAGVTLTQPTGTAPQSLAVQFTAVPTAGESVSIGLTLPDGSEDGITLTAVTGTPGAGEFQIGADATATAANFAASLQTVLTSMGQTKLAAASTYAAADTFFNAHGDPVLRVDGPPFDSATALVTADPATTMIWYKGEDSADPRGSVTAKIDEGTSVRYGVQANETGLRELVMSLAAVAVQSYQPADPNAHAKFDAIAARNVSRLAESHNSEDGSIEMITVELGNTQAAAKSIGDRHNAYKAQLETMLSDIESVSDEEVAMEMLALQVRLQASYQATAMISQLSLVNYLS
jgi:flagellar hook-associated protein 3 FlgL